MKEIKLYRPVASGLMKVSRGEFKHGDLVKFEDHAAVVDALQEQVQQLAEENVAQRDHCDEVYGAGYQQGHLNTVDGIAYAPGIKDGFYHDALQVMAEVDTPATDAVIREIGAKAVEGFTEWCWDESASPGDNYHLAAEKAEKYAAKLRAGEQS